METLVLAVVFYLLLLIPGIVIVALLLAALNIPEMPPMYGVAGVAYPIAIPIMLLLLLIDRTKKHHVREKLGN